MRPRSSRVLAATAATAFLAAAVATLAVARGFIGAIDTDPAGPFLGIVDLGMVSDLHEVAPGPTRHIRDGGAA